MIVIYDKMFGTNRNSYPDGEKVILRTRPRIFIHSKSVIIKILFIGLLFYSFNSIISFTVTIQSYLIEFVQIPLVQGVSIAILLIIFFLILWAVWDLISWKFTEYILTNQRIIIQKGMLNKKRSYIRYNKVQDVVIYQNLLERIFSSGDIEIFSGHENTSIILENIPQPYHLEDKINRMIDQNLSYTQMAREIQKEMEGETNGEIYTQNPPRRGKKPIMENHARKFKR
ncbi:MAG: PH domain-containing protein [Euryarchaeota archaeon]